MRDVKQENKKQKLARKFAEVNHRKGGIWAVYKLFHRYFYKSFFGPFFTFVFPVLIYAILGNLMDSKLLFSGVIAMSAMSVGLNGMPFSIMELKKSVLLKRIGASPVKPSAFTIVILTYYLVVIFISLLWLMLWAFILFRDPSMFGPLGTVIGFFGFLYGNLLNIVMSLSIGFLIATISRSEMQAQAIGLLVYFPSSFLSGQFISIDVIAKSEVMNWISRFIPFRYTTMIIVEAWNGDVFNPIPQFLGTGLPELISRSNPFNIHDYSTFKWNTFDIQEAINDPTYGGLTLKDYLVSKGYRYLVIYDVADHICGYVVPYATALLSASYAIKNFNWSAAR